MSSSKQYPELRCTESVEHPLITLKERRSTVVFHNPRRRKISKVQVDGCLFHEGARRCDYLIHDRLGASSYFVELKGSDIQIALLQLEESHTQLKASCERRVLWVIVTAKKVKIPKQRLGVLKRKLMMKRCVELIVGKSPVTIPLP